MVKRFTLCLLALLMLVSAVACTPTPTPPPEQDDPIDDPTNEPSIPPREGLLISEQTAIVCASAYDEYLDRAVMLLQSAIKDATGISLPIIRDKEEAYPQEIVVGLCARVDTVSAPVTFDDEKLIIAVENTAELYCLVRAFSDRVPELCEKDSEGGWHLYQDTVLPLAEMDTAYDTNVRVLTQNLRYANDADGNSVAERSLRFAALVEEYRPDIIGTQEATPLWTQYLTENFSDEYGMIGVFRDGTGHAGDEANYVLYRKDRFELVDSGTFWLTDEPDRVGKVEGALCNRICTWAWLRDVRTDKLLMIANTHLDHSNDAIRKAQIDALLGYLADDMKSYPIFMTGDFNALRTSEPYKTILGAGLYDGEKRAWLNDSNLNYTCHLYRGHGDTIDYCFFSKQWTPMYARIVSDDYGGYVSDHYGVIVDFVRFES